MSDARRAELELQLAKALSEGGFVWSSPGQAWYRSATQDRIVMGELIAAIEGVSEAVRWFAVAAIQRGEPGISVSFDRRSDGLLYAVASTRGGESDLGDGRLRAIAEEVRFALNGVDTTARLRTACEAFIREMRDRRAP